MGDDEEHTIKTITAYRETISRLISKQKGRVVDSPGSNSGWVEGEWVAS
jgi:hypothetical protein